MSSAQDDGQSAWTEGRSPQLQTRPEELLELIVDLYEALSDSSIDQV